MAPFGIALYAFAERLRPTLAGWWFDFESVRLLRMEWHHCYWYWYRNHSYASSMVKKRNETKRSVCLARKLPCRRRRCTLGAIWHGDTNAGNFDLPLWIDSTWWLRRRNSSMHNEWIPTKHYGRPTFIRSALRS